jgi:hypothetical protein
MAAEGLLTRGWTNFLNRCNSPSQIFHRRTSMSFKAEIIADSTGEWTANNCAYETREEADHAGRDLMGRWMAVREMRVVESPGQINARWNPATYQTELL